MRDTISKIMGHTTNATIFEEMSKGAKEYGWHKWASDYPVTEELEPLLNKILVAMPHIKIYPRNTTRLVRPTQEIRIVNEFYLYTDTCAFPLGHVGFRDYSVGRNDTKPVYGVYSRKIENAKYHDSRDEFHMQMTSDLDKAFKIVKSYMTPYTDKELATEYFSELRNHIDNTQHQIRRELDQLIGKIKWGADNQVIEEILHLKNQGIKFKTEIFNEVSNSIEELNAKVKEEATRKISALFVHFRKVGDDTYADVEEVGEIKNTRFGKPEFVSPPTTYLMSELPEDILNGVSVLNILADEQYVPRIGQKINSETFWLERG